MAAHRTVKAGRCGSPVRLYGLSPALLVIAVFQRYSGENVHPCPWCAKGKKKDLLRVLRAADGQEHLPGSIRIIGSLVIRQFGHHHNIQKRLVANVV